MTAFPYSRLVSRGAHISGNDALLVILNFHYNSYHNNCGNDARLLILIFKQQYPKRRTLALPISSASAVQSPTRYSPNQQVPIISVAKV